MFERLKGSESGKGTDGVLIKYADIVTQFGDAPELIRQKAVDAAVVLANLDIKGVKDKISEKAKELVSLERSEGIRRKWAELRR